MESCAGIDVPGQLSVAAAVSPFFFNCYRQRKGATVLTKIFFAEENECEARDGINAVLGTYHDIDRPRLETDQVTGLHFCQYTGFRLHEIPFALRRLKIEKVELIQRSAVSLNDNCESGRYESRNAFGYVEHTITWNREGDYFLTQYITVTGETLDAANNLMDAIISGAAKPVLVKPQLNVHRRLVQRLKAVFSLNRFQQYLIYPK